MKVGGVSQFLISSYKGEGGISQLKNILQEGAKSKKNMQNSLKFLMIFSEYNSF